MEDKNSEKFTQIVALLMSVESAMDVAIEKADDIPAKDFGVLYNDWTRARYLMEGAKLNAKVALEILQELKTW